MPFGMVTRVVLMYHALDWDADPQGEGVIFRGCPPHWKP